MPGIGATPRSCFGSPPALNIGRSIQLKSKAYPVAQIIELRPTLRWSRWYNGSATQGGSGSFARASGSVGKPNLLCFDVGIHFVQESIERGIAMPKAFT